MAQGDKQFAVTMLTRLQRSAYSCSFSCGGRHKAKAKALEVVESYLKGAGIKFVQSDEFQQSGYPPTTGREVTIRDKENQEKLNELVNRLKLEQREEGMQR